MSLETFAYIILGNRNENNKLFLAMSDRVCNKFGDLKIKWYCEFSVLGAKELPSLKVTKC